MDVKLGGRYQYNYVSPWDIDKVALDKAHHGLSCRILRRIVSREIPNYSANPLTCADLDHLAYVVFDDGYITVASSESELCPLPME